MQSDPREHNDCQFRFSAQRIRRTEAIARQCIINQDPVSPEEVATIAACSLALPQLLSRASVTKLRTSDRVSVPAFLSLLRGVVVIARGMRGEGCVCVEVNE